MAVQRAPNLTYSNGTGVHNIPTSVAVSATASVPVIPPNIGDPQARRQPDWTTVSGDPLHSYPLAG